MAMERMYATKVRGYYREVLETCYDFCLDVTDVFYEEDGWRYFGVVTTATGYAAFKNYILINRIKDPADIEFDVFYTQTPLDD